MSAVVEESNFMVAPGSKFASPVYWRAYDELRSQAAQMSVRLQVTMHLDGTYTVVGTRNGGHVVAVGADRLEALTSVLEQFKRVS